VQALLLHLQQAGTSGVPRPLGFDELGRETVSYLEGDVWNDPLPELVWRESTLMAAAALLRRLHDATVGFRPAAGARWMLAMPADLPVEVVCHNDFAPYNVVFTGDRPVGVIDWETAAPGARVWDVAYAAYRFVPLSQDAPPALRDVPVQARRLGAFCGEYGLGGPDRAILVATVSRRVSALRELLLERAASGDRPFEAALALGHAEHYAADLAHLAGSGSALEEWL
jgi:aminoglycoside phosphotransferase (APT) family kinase protein